MLAVGSLEGNFRAIATYVKGMGPVIVASFVHQLNSMQAGGYELCILAAIVRIVVPGVLIPIVVHVLHDGPDLYFEA